MRKSKQQRPKAKRSLSTVPRLDTLREFDRDCRERGVTPSERLRQILDQHYSNERLKSIGRDVAESPIRNLQKQAMAEELSPLKSKLTEVEKTVQTVRSMAEEILGNLAQMSLREGSTSGEDAGEQIARLESAVAELAANVARLGERRGEEGGKYHQPPSLSNIEIMRELESIKAVTAKLAIQTLIATVRSAVQAEIKERHVVYVKWSREAGITIYTIRKVVEKVADPLTEIALDDARIRYGTEVRVGSQVSMNLLPRSDFVRVVAETINQIFQSE